MTTVRPQIPLVSELEHHDPSTLVADLSNARMHPRRQLAALKKGISTLGFLVPLVIDENRKILSGHARHQAALELNLKTVPCLRVDYLDEPQKKAASVALNRLGDMSSFDRGRLAKTLSEICTIEFDPELTGFTSGEIDILLTPPSPAGVGADAADAFEAPDLRRPAITQPGDIWRLGGHLIACDDARSEAVYHALLGEAHAGLVFADPPFNVPIPGHVSGLGQTVHPDFAMACGEMSPADFTRFLQTAMQVAARFSVDGSLHYWCGDWRHMREILGAGDAVYTELKALCVWNKTNGGMGSFYRSRHELVFVFKNGTAPHVNNIDLGRNGRYRTNVWDYPGANAFGPNRESDLADHPTVKPVALIADIIRDASRRNAVVLDPFAGSGTTILAAERTGRKTVAIEIAPHYCDVAIRRWQGMTDGTAVRTAGGRSFNELAAAPSAMEASDERS